MSFVADLELLADPVRVRALALLEMDELSVGELAKSLALPQPTVSRHLKALTQGEWLVRRTVATAAFLRLGALTSRQQELWRLVRDAPDFEAERAQDRDRMARVLAEREADAATFFGRVADGWDVLRDQLFGRRFLPTAIGAMLPRDQVVVDLGCGTGELLTHLAPSVSRAIGVDREPGMLAVARRRLARHPHVEIVEGALEAVPVADASADLALLVLVLHHLPEPGAALAEARRILKPSGKLVVVDMQPHETTAWRTFGHLHQGFSATTVSALAATAGLEVTRYDPLEPEAEVQGPPLFLSTMAVPSSQAAPGPARAKSDRGLASRR